MTAQARTWTLDLSRDVAPEKIVARLTFPGDPASKSRARVVQRGGKSHSYTPKATKAAEEALGWAIRAARGSGVPDGDSNFGVCAAFFTASWQRRDVDNMLKLVLDACTGVVWGDDAQVTEVAARVVRAVPDPRSELTIYVTELQAPPGTTCRVCSTAIRIYPSWKERRYCSQRCAGLARIYRVIVPCLTCAKPMEHTSKKKPAYCSRECFAVTKRLPFTCAHCGKTGVRPQWRKGRERDYCDDECRIAFWRAHRKARSAGTCADCGGPTSKRQYTRCQACQYRHAASTRGAS